jgi:hypothetical protein
VPDTEESSDHNTEELLRELSPRELLERVLLSKSIDRSKILTRNSQLPKAKRNNKSEEQS